MSHQTLKSFIDLVTFDQHHIETQKKIASLEHNIKKNQEQKAVAQSQLDQVSLKKHDQLKTVHSQELALSELQQQEESLQKTLQSVSSSKEYEAATKELEHVRLSRTVQEQKLTQYSNKMHASQKEHDAAAERFQAATAVLTVELASLQQELDALHQELQLIDSQRQTKTVGIPHDWISVYDLMRGRVVDPVVPLLQDSCSACFYAVTPRDLQLLHKSSMIQCKDCYRFLYETTAV